MIGAILLGVVGTVVLAALGYIAFGFYEYRRDAKTILIPAAQISITSECSHCGCRFDAHMLINRSGDPMDGGEMVCRTTDCDCATVWTVTLKEKVKSS